MKLWKAKASKKLKTHNIEKEYAQKETGRSPF